jgi:glutathione peroxidase
MSKISVQGDDMHPIYKFLTEKAENGVEDVEVKWNFQKFLIDENGNYVQTVHHKTDPLNDTIINWLMQTKLDL